jgi:hypothetical protein
MKRMLIIGRGITPAVSQTVIERFEVIKKAICPETDGF